MAEKFNEMLAEGGHANSLGRANDVIDLVLNDQSRLAELYSCLFDQDAWTRMRAADALEKICRQHPDWILPYVDKFANDLAPSTQPSIQWHLAQIYSEVDLTTKQKRFAINWLKHVLSTKDADWIVAANAMDTLAQFTKDGSSPVADIVPLLKIQQKHKSNAVIKRANKLLAELSGSMTKRDAKQIQFKSKDGLTITADYYEAHEPKSHLLLCHRSHFNRGEYAEIAPKLVDLGYTCLALDQRSGMNVLGFINETSTRAKQQDLPTGYLDARQDIEAGVDHLYKLANDRPIIILGSSYSASLALIVGEHSEKVKAIAAFSPGEYLKKTVVSKEIAGYKKPIFVTSAKKEITDTSKVVQYIDKKYVTRFEPDVEGFHGARALWDSVKGNQDYWDSLSSFLDSQSAS